MLGFRKVSTFEIDAVPDLSQTVDMAGSAVEVLAQLRKARVATTRELIKGAATDRMKISRLSRSGGPLRRIAQGVYTLRGLRLTPVDEMVAVLKCCPRGAICGPSAAWVHGLLTARPADIWLAIGKRDRIPALGELRAQVVRWSGPSLAPAKHLRPKFNQLRVTDIKHTLLTCVHAHRRIGMPLVKKIFASAQKKGVIGRPTMIAVHRALVAAEAFPPLVVPPPIEQFLLLR